MRLVFYSALIIIITFVFLFKASNDLLSQNKIEELKQEIAAKEAEIKRLEEEEARYRKSLNQAILQSRTLKGEINRIDASIKQLNYRIKILRAELDSTILRLKMLSSDIDETEIKIKKRKSQIAKLLQEIAYLDENGLLTILFASPTISDFFNNIIQLINFEKAMQEDLFTIKQLKEKLEIDKIKQEELQKKQQKQEQEFLAKLAISELKKEDRQKLLEKTKNDESRYQKLLSENQKRQREILQEIEALEFELRKLILQISIPPRSPGLFIWPLEGGYITQEYGDTRSTGFINDFYKFHNGIDFGHPDGIGTPILAVMDGKVIAVGDLSPYAYGRWIAIDHGNGLTTLYAHLARFAVSKGEFVKQGRVIGYMGSTGFATGPHLHFTVYATETFKTLERSYGLLPLGASINPRDYLAQ